VKIVGTIFASNKSWPMQTIKLQSMLMFVDTNLSFLMLSLVFLDLFFASVDIILHDSACICSEYITKGIMRWSR
jgi:hypothetical protein